MERPRETHVEFESASPLHTHRVRSAAAREREGNGERGREGLKEAGDAAGKRKVREGFGVGEEEEGRPKSTRRRPHPFLRLSICHGDSGGGRRRMRERRGGRGRGSAGGRRRKKGRECVNVCHDDYRRYFNFPTKKKKCCRGHKKEKYCIPKVGISHSGK